MDIFIPGLFGLNSRTRNTNISMCGGHTQKATKTERRAAVERMTKENRRAASAD